MKTFAALMLMLLLMVPLDRPQAGPLSILGVAGQYNVFVFGNLNLSQTDVEGRAAAGGDVTLSSFAIGSKLQDETGIATLVAGRNLNLTSGSVGCLESAFPACVTPKNGTVVYGGDANVPNTTVAHGVLTENGSYIDFATARTYLEGLSTSLGNLAANGSDVDLSPNFDFTGTNSALNVFSLNAADILTDATTGPSFNFHVLAGTTILLNITGDAATVNLRNMSFAYNGISGENPPAPGEIYSHNAAFPYSGILFNFPDATETIALDRIALNGSILAPFANITFTRDSHIDGNVMAMSLSGQGESHAIPFQGTLVPAAVPEPGTLLLLVAGLAGLLTRRRR